MSDKAGECIGPGDDGVGNCGREVFRENFCATHVKQAQRNNGKMVPIDTRSPWERVIDAKDDLEDALKSDETEGLVGKEYDERCDKAERAFRRAIESFGKRNKSPEDAARLADLERDALAQRKRTLAIRAGMARAKADGKRISREPLVDPKKVVSLIKKLRRPVIPPLDAAVKRAAKQLRVAERTVWRALRRLTDTRVPCDSERGDASSSGPQSG